MTKVGDHNKTHINIADLIKYGVMVSHMIRMDCCLFGLQNYLNMLS